MRGTKSYLIRENEVHNKKNVEYNLEKLHRVAEVQQHNYIHVFRAAIGERSVILTRRLGKGEIKAPHRGKAPMRAKRGL